MPLATGTPVEITLKATNGGQDYTNVWSYVRGGDLTDPSAVNLAEAWWNHVKTVYRALPNTGMGAVFNTVVVRQMNNAAGELAEFSIPTGERTGTRTPPAASEGLPTFNATGVRLTVGTRVTRPGQKRIGWMTESDVAGNDVAGAWITLVTNLMNVMSVEFVLGAPAAAAVLTPVVASKDAEGLYDVTQDITGYLINSQVTSQVSRKAGRGN